MTKSEASIGDVRGVEPENNHRERIDSLCIEKRRHAISKIQEGIVIVDYWIRVKINNPQTAISNQFTRVVKAGGMAIVESVKKQLARVTYL